MTKGQKEAVVEEIKLALPSFVPFKDNATLYLGNLQLENIKTNIMVGIINGIIDYSKDRNNHNEVRAYARSMVMNHLKKAKELNGGYTYKAIPTGITGDIDETGTSSPQTRTVRVKEKIAPKGVNPDLLPADLREYVKTLI